MKQKVEDFADKIFPDSKQDLAQNLFILVAISFLVFMFFAGYQLWTINNLLEEKGCKETYSHVFPEKMEERQKKLEEWNLSLNDTDVELAKPPG